MTTHYEWHSTTHPFFTVEKMPASDIDDTIEPGDESDKSVLLIKGIAADEIAVIEGDLEEFAVKTVAAVFGVPMRKVFGMWQESEDGVILHWMPVHNLAPLSANEKKAGWRLGWRWIFESAVEERLDG